MRDFRLWWLAALGMVLSLQMLEVVIGWQLYAQHHSALLLGWVGLAEFLPLVILALPAGHLADRAPRRLIFAGSLMMGVGIGLGLAALSHSGNTSEWPYLALAAAAGCAMAIGNPASRAMPPTLVPPEILSNAMTLRAVGAQFSMVAGPAVGGVLFGVSPTIVYLSTAGICVLAAMSALRISPAPAADVPSASRPAAPGMQTVLEGLRFVGRTQILLGAILLDLIAVLFGGAVALLPVFADSILHVGSVGLGILRAAPAFGAFVGAIVLTRWPLKGRAGRTLLIVVGLFGVSTIVFGLSRWYPLSLAALAVGGFVDLISVNIRSTTVALATPDRLRGRVNAVEMVFISASNQLGAFESGLAAFLVGTVPAVVGGGVITILVVLGWSRLFPDLANVDRLEDLRPVEEGSG
ncbi:MAG TPA: MFS transporter [Solirubrobacteraceae bacterium]|nr:MFS transporter [Solirubrobacteraceae bacterium]